MTKTAETDRMDESIDDGGSLTRTSSSCSILGRVPKECQFHIFKYLTLYECLTCLPVSKATFVQLIPELKRRRNVQFLTNHQELLRQVDTSEGRKIVCVKVQPVTASTNDGREDARNANSNNADFNDDNNRPYLQPLLISEEKTEQFFTLPTVRLRIIRLHRSLPASHPLNNDVRDLKVNLEKAWREERRRDKDCTADEDDDNNNNVKTKGTKGDDTVSDRRVSDLLELLRDVTTAHRLHSSLLRRCTVDLDPNPSSLSIYDHYNHQATPDRNRRDLTVTLDQYMGDVIAAYYLTAHSFSGIVEGPSFATEWVDGDLALLAKFQDGRLDNVDIKVRRNDQQQAPYRWYKLWIFLHSVLLRNLPLTFEQADEHVRLGPVAGIRFEHQTSEAVETTNNDNDGETETNIADNETTDSVNSSPAMRKIPWFRPPVCFSLGVVDHNAILHNKASPTDYVDRIFGKLADTVHVGMHQTTLNHFGPLGPAFRGRDNVTTQTMSPFTLIGLLTNHCRLLLTDPYFGLRNNEQAVQSESKMGRFLSNNDALMKWVTDTLNESRRVRPMTVLPPLVTIRVTDL